MGIAFSSTDLQGGVMSGSPSNFDGTSFGFAPTDTKSFGVIATISDGFDHTYYPVLTLPGGATAACEPITQPGTDIVTYTTNLNCDVANTAISPGLVTIDFDVLTSNTPFFFSVATAVATNTVQTVLTTNTTVFVTATNTASSTVTVTPSTTLTGASSTVFSGCATASTQGNNTTTSTRAYDNTKTIKVTRTKTVCPCDSTSNIWSAWQKAKREPATSAGTTSSPGPIYGPPSITFSGTVMVTTYTSTYYVTQNATTTITVTNPITVYDSTTTIDSRTVTTVSGCAQNTTISIDTGSSSTPSTTLSTTVSNTPIITISITPITTISITPSTTLSSTTSTTSSSTSTTTTSSSSTTIILQPCAVGI